MRTLKFRYWDVKNKKFDTDIGIYLVGGVELANTMPAGYEITQFTGLTDRHGVEIYEGDIVDTPDGRTMVTWWKAGFYFKFLQENGRGDWVDIPPEVEVIGNIYENPKLLKEVA